MRRSRGQTQHAQQTRVHTRRWQAGSPQACSEAGARKAPAALALCPQKSHWYWLSPSSISGNSMLDSDSANTQREAGAERARSGCKIGGQIPCAGPVPGSMSCTAGPQAFHSGALPPLQGGPHT